MSVDTVAPGGQAATSSRVENHLGFPSGISGAEPAERAPLQTAEFGARISAPVNATALPPQDGYNIVRFADGSEISCRDGRTGGMRVRAASRVPRHPYGARQGLSTPG